MRLARTSSGIWFLVSRSTVVVDQSAPQHGNAVDEEVLAMVVRVRKKGRVTKRQLFRSYNNQDYARLTPVLESAISNGLLIEAEDGKVALAT